MKSRFVQGYKRSQDLKEDLTKCAFYNMDDSDDKADVPEEMHGASMFNHQRTDLHAMTQMENGPVEIDLTPNYVIVDYGNSLFGNPDTGKSHKFFEVAERKDVDEYLNKDGLYSMPYGFEPNKTLTVGQTKQLINKIKNSRELKVREETILFNTKIGFYANPPGSGKTRVCVSLAVTNTDLVEKDLADFSTSDYNIVKVSSSIDDSYHYFDKLTLIVCPHSIVHQWVSEIDTYTDVYYDHFATEQDMKDFLRKEIDFRQDEIDSEKEVVLVESVPTRMKVVPQWMQEQLDEDVRFDKISLTCKKTGCTAHDHTSRLIIKYVCDFKELKKKLKILSFLVVSQKLLVIFTNISRGYKFLRTFVDEVDQLKFPRAFTNKSTFTWVITATPMKFANNRKYFPPRWSAMVNMYKNPDFFKFFTVRSQTVYIHDSIKLPKIRYFHIETVVNSGFSKLMAYLGPTVVDLINSCNLEAAYKQLLNDCDMPIPAELEKKKENKKAAAPAKKKPAPEPESDSGSEEASEEDESEEEGSEASDESEEASEEEESAAEIERRQYNPSKFVKVLQQSYGNKLYDAKINLTGEQSKRQPNQNTIATLTKNILVYEKTLEQLRLLALVMEADPEGETGLDKREALAQVIEYLKEKRKKLKILAFSNSVQSRQLIEDVATKVEIPYGKLVGTGKRIQNLLNELKECIVNMLILDSGTYGCGLDIQMADFLIYFNRMEKKEGQMDGRGQRPGRTTPLVVINLINAKTEKAREGSVVLKSRKDFHLLL